MYHRNSYCYGLVVSTFQVLVSENSLQYCQFSRNSSNRMIQKCLAPSYEGLTADPLPISNCYRTG